MICVDNLVAGKLENIDHLMGNKEFRFVGANVLELSEQAFKGVEIIFHEACSKCTVCQLFPDLDLRVNAWGTFSVLENAVKVGAKIIHASTGSVNNGRPKSFYGVSKQAGESYVRAFREYYPDFEYGILRYYHVYGPRQDSGPFGGVIPIFARQSLSGQCMTIFGDGEQVRHFTSVKDVVRANLFAANQDEPCEFDVVSDTRITIDDLADRIGELTGNRWKDYQDATRGDIRSFDVSNMAIKADGFQFSIPFDKGLKETVDWYREVFNG